MKSRDSVTTYITKGGQISVPARVRKRWKTRKVIVEDHGDSLEVHPATEDELAKYVGCLSSHFENLQSIDDATRADEVAAEKRA